MTKRERYYLIRKKRFKKIRRYAMGGAGGLFTSVSWSEDAHSKGRGLMKKMAEYILGRLQQPIKDKLL